VKRTIEMTVCDLHGDEHDAGTHTLTLDGKAITIDLCGDAEEALADALAPFVAVARRVRDGRVIVNGSRPKLLGRTIAPSTNGSGVGAPANGATLAPAFQPAATTTRTTLPLAYDKKACRAWWRSNPRGLPTWKPMGPIPRTVREAYEKTMEHV